LASTLIFQPAKKKVESPSSLKEVLKEVVLLELDVVANSEKLNCQPGLLYHPGSLQARLNTNESLLKAYVREKPLKPLTPFFRTVVDELYRNYGRLAPVEVFEDLVRGHTHQNWEQLNLNREFLRNQASSIEVLKILTEQQEARKAVYKKFPVTSDENLDVVESKPSEFIEAANQRWLDAMLYLKNKGFGYWIAEKAANKNAFWCGKETDPYQCFVSGYPHKRHLEEPEFFNHPEIKEWRKSDESETKRIKDIMAEWDKRDEQQKKQLDDLKPVLKGYIVKGWVDETILFKLRESFKPSILHLSLIREAMKEVKRLRDSGVKPRRKVTLKVEPKEEEQPETLAQRWINCMAYASGKPDQEGKMHDAIPFDTAVKKCTFMVYRHTGKLPSQATFDKVKKYWVPGYWLLHVDSDENGDWKNGFRK